MAAVREFAAAGGPVLGICNGFQVLTEAGLLPGILRPNTHLQFRCEEVGLRVQHESAWLPGAVAGDVLTIPVKHHDGCFFATAEQLDDLDAGAQVLLRYVQNPNGSLESIACVTNEAGNVAGLMPHPEHAVDPVLGSVDGRILLQGLLEQAAMLRAPRPEQRLNAVTRQPLHRSLGLTDGEHERIGELLEREPNDFELAVFSLLWSEHCAYKHSRALLAGLPTAGERVLQGPGENAGVIDVGDGIAVALKVESHNHPSAVEPFQGAATGVGGILRDIIAMGARPIAILDSLRFGELDSERQRHLFARVVEGVGHYGNCVGVANVGGEVEFEPAYEHNCLVNAMCVGRAAGRPAAEGRRGGGRQPARAVRVEDRAATASAAPACSRRRASRRAPRPSARASRSATRSPARS